MDDKELPEWYHMAKGFFREIEVFSTSMYQEMNGSGILAQIRYAALREAAQHHVKRTACPNCGSTKSSFDGPECPDCGMA